MDGLIYILNQAGVALAQANARIAALEQELARIPSPTSSDPAAGASGTRP